MSNEYKKQIEQVIQLLTNPKTLKASLEVFLSLSESTELVDIFIELNVPKIMLRLLENEDMHEKSLVAQVMINLSTNEKYVESFLSINTFHRVINLLFKLIDVSLKKDEPIITDPDQIFIGNDLLLDKNGNPYDVKMQLDKYVIDSDKFTDPHPKVINENLINLYFMFLANLTSYESGQKKFLDLDNEKIKGIVFFKILDKFFEYIYHNSFDFCSALLANASSLKEGRDLILENKVFKIFLIQFDKMNNMKVVNILRLFRNCAFEYEKYHEDLLVKDSILFDFLIKILILINDKNQSTNVGLDSIDVIYLNNFKTEISDQDKETINDLIVDIFLIFTNHPDAVQNMKNKNLIKVVNIIEERLKETQKNTEAENKLKDRLLVIKNYLEN